MLYWAEGTKDKNSIRFTNSDPSMVTFFRRFLVEALEIEPADIHLSVNAYTDNGLTMDEIERHWLELLGLPHSSVRSHTVNRVPTSRSGLGAHKLPYGVPRLSVHQTSKVQHIYGAIQEYAGFDEPRWVDGPGH